MKKLRVSFVAFVVGVAVLAPLAAPAGAQAPPTGTTARERADYSVGFSRNTIEIELAASSDVTVANGRLAGPADELDRLDETAGGIRRAEKLLRGAERNHRAFEARAARTTGRSIPDPNDHVTITVPETDDIGAVAKELEALDFVETATPKMLPTPPPSPDYSALQTYLGAERGLNATFANNFVGGKGENVTIVDLEYAWNVDHEDLKTVDHSDERFIYEYANPFTGDHHGTAVASILVGDHDGSGVDGMAPAADLKLVNTYNATNGWNIGGAIYSALEFMQPGDIMLIEQQATGRSADPYGYVPVEIMPAVYDAIVTATAMGITVIEPAGNGNQNLSNTALYGTTFPDGKPNSGAIVVGASNACSTSAPNARAYFSSYGSRVNVYADGECVAAAGYGTIQTGTNQEYTAYFNGTSSASAIIAGAAALVSSAAQADGKTLTPLQLRAALTTTGLPQDPPTSTYIGRKPQIRQAIFSRVRVGLTSCYSSTDWFALNISRNYFKNPTVDDAQKFAVNVIANVYKDKPGTAPVSFATNGPWCATSKYDATEMAQLDQLSTYLALDYRTTQAYSGVLLGTLLVYFGLV